VGTADGDAQAALALQQRPDGRPLQRVGLIPDIEVKPTLAGIRAGRDEVLERAIAYVESVTPRP
jgi:C-terminal processing protease CtpA/Prc